VSRRIRQICPQNLEKYAADNCGPIPNNNTLVIGMVYQHTYELIHNVSCL